MEQSIKEFSDRFINRIFTLGEQEYCANMSYPAPHYAARFAAKEAVSKALGVGIGRHLGWLDMEILRDSLGKPSVTLSGRGKDFAESKGISEIMISLSHSRDHAAANAVAICGD